jgi:hypothetical protein
LACTPEHGSSRLPDASKVGGVLSVCVPVHPRSGSHSPHSDREIHAPLPRVARPPFLVGLRQETSFRRTLLLWELRCGWAGTGTGHPSAFLKRFGKAKSHMTFQPILAARQESVRKLAEVAPGSPESPRLEGGPSALPTGEPGQVPGVRGPRVTPAPPDPGALACRPVDWYNRWL